MNRNPIFLALALGFLLSTALFSSAETASMWSKTYGGTGYDQGYSLVATSDGGYAVAGVTDSNNGDVLLIKTDAVGNMQWNRIYEGALTESVHSLIQTADGGYLMAGNKFSFNLPYPGGYQGPWIEDAWMIKTDSYGNVQWNKTYSRLSSYCGFYSLIPSSDGGYIAAGYTTPTSSSPSWMAQWTLWLTKVDIEGNIVWSKTYEQAGMASDPLWMPGITIDDGFQIACSIVPGPDGYTVAGGNILLKTDPLGTMQWNKTHSGTFSSLVATLDGGYAACGKMADAGSSANGLNSNSSDCWLAKIDASGNLQWNKTYGDVGHDDFANSLVRTPEGGYAIAGTCNFTYYVPIGYPEKEIYSGDAWLIKTDGFGNMLWNHTYGGDGIDRAYSLVLTSDGGYAIAGGVGLSGLPMSFSSDVWLTKTDGLGVVPELSSWLIPTLAVSATGIFLFGKKRLLCKTVH